MKVNTRNFETVMTPRGVHIRIRLCLLVSDKFNIEHIVETPGSDIGDGDNVEIVIDAERYTLVTMLQAMGIEVDSTADLSDYTYRVVPDIPVTHFIEWINEHSVHGTKLGIDRKFVHDKKQGLVVCTYCADDAGEPVGPEDE